MCLVTFVRFLICNCIMLKCRDCYFICNVCKFTYTCVYMLYKLQIGNPVSLRQINDATLHLVVVLSATLGPFPLHFGDGPSQ